MTSFKTAKGTILPIMDLKGKAYLQVAYRIQWFREEYREGQILTEIISESPSRVTFKAFIHNEDGKLLATATKTLDIKNTTDYEKCETGAIGRALALCGYGTQFAAEDLDEQDDLADSPLDPKIEQASSSKSSAKGEGLPGTAAQGVPPTSQITKFPYGKTPYGVNLKDRPFKEVLEIDSKHGLSYSDYWYRQFVAGEKLLDHIFSYLEYCRLQRVQFPSAKK